MTSLRIVFVLAVVATFCNNTLGLMVNSPPWTQPDVYEYVPKIEFPLAKAIKQPISDYTMDELAEMWDAFKHAPIETAGFNQLSLPFRYASLDGSGDTAEADAFAFLLSYMIDWAPGGYCTRHAYFVFKRARKKIMPFRQQYNRRVIKYLVNDWTATHAVGGVLRQSEKGYSGVLEIYDRAGQLVLMKVYKADREFFDLLGDMSVDAMKFFGHTPSPALIELLHLPQWKHHESIIDLGRAALLEQDSDEEFALYAKILKRDPEFAHVRDWWRNRIYWLNNYDSKKQETALAKLPERKVPRRFEDLRKLAPEITGPNALEVLLEELEIAEQSSQVTQELLERATPIAARYPNSHGLAYWLGRAYYQGPCDCDIAASIQLLGIRDRYLTGGGGKQYSTRKFALPMMLLGHNEIAAQVLRPLVLRLMRSEGVRGAALSAELLAKSLVGMGQYAEALKYFKIAVRGRDKGENLNNMLVDMGVAAALAGEPDTLNQIIQYHRTDLLESKMLFLLEAYRDVLAGRFVRNGSLMEKYGDISWEDRYKVLCFVGQRAIMWGKPWYRPPITEYMKNRPNDRSTWILYDAYDRADPKAESAGFYEALEWLHGSDPWVKKAVRDFRRRTKTTSILTADELSERLKDFEPVRWPDFDSSKVDLARKVHYGLPPFAAEAAIYRLVQSGDYDQAEELALRYHHLAVHIYYALRGHGNHLIHLVRQAREKSERRSTTRPATRRKPR